jgi:hypothetical protein
MANRFGDQEATQPGVNRFGDAAATAPPPTPPGFGERLYEQTLQGPVELAKGLWNDPKGTLMQTIASMAATQMQAARNPLQVQQGLATPIIEDVRSGNWRGFTGDVLGDVINIFGPKVLAETPRAVRAGATYGKGFVPGAAAKFAERGDIGIPKWGVSIGNVPFGETIQRGGIGYGIGKYVAGTPGGIAGATVAAGGPVLRAGHLSGRAALAARAEAAAAELRAARAKEWRTAYEQKKASARNTRPPDDDDDGPGGGSPMPPTPPPSGFPSGRKPGHTAPSGPIVTPEAAASPPEPVVTPPPAPMTPAQDAAMLRNAERAVKWRASQEAAQRMRQEMGLQPGQFETPAIAEAAEATAAQIDRAARAARQVGFNPKDFSKVQTPQLQELAKSAGYEGPLGDFAQSVRKRMEAIAKAEAETAKIQAALDRLTPAERSVTRADEAPAVERKPPATAAVAEPTVTTPLQANEYLGKQYPAPAPVEASAALTAVQKRVKGLSEWLAKEKNYITDEDLSNLATDADLRIDLADLSHRLKLGAPQSMSEIHQIIAEVKRLRSEAPVAK